MTGPHPDPDSPEPISVAELLARNGTIGAPAFTRRRRRRRGDSEAVTVAELTGEIPVIRDDDETDHAVGGPDDAVAERVTEERPKPAYWSEPEPRWPKSEPITTRKTGPERSEYPRPVRHAEEVSTSDAEHSGADSMSPDPVGHYTAASVDVLSDEALVDARSRLNPAGWAMLSALWVTDASQLVLIAHHLAVDGVSWRILLEDMNIAWAQHRGGQQVVLPGAGTSFARWASLLQEHARAQEVVDQADAWRKRLAELSKK